MAIHTTDLRATLGKSERRILPLTEVRASKHNSLLDDLHDVVAHRGFRLCRQMRPRRGLGVGIWHVGDDRSCKLLERRKFPTTDLTYTKTSIWTSTFTVLSVSVLGWI